MTTDRQNNKFSFKTYCFIELVPFDQVKIKHALYKHCNLTTNLIGVRVRRKLLEECINCSQQQYLIVTKDKVTPFEAVIAVGECVVQSTMRIALFAAKFRSLLLF